jgi:hypothetical protein
MHLTAANEGIDFMKFSVKKNRNVSAIFFHEGRHLDACANEVQHMRSSRREHHELPISSRCRLRAGIHAHPMQTSQSSQKPCCARRFPSQCKSISTRRTLAEKFLASLPHAASRATHRRRAAAPNGNSNYSLWKSRPFLGNIQSFCALRKSQSIAHAFALLHRSVPSKETESAVITSHQT